MALGYVYRQGLIHRDVKPANLLAVIATATHHRRQGQRLRQRAATCAPTRTQIYRVGSLAYMSPEQLDGGTLDCRADIYSLAPCCTT